MKELFYIKEVSAWINPLMVSSIYRAGFDWRVKMSNGSDYPLTGDEYDRLIKAFVPEENNKDNDLEELKQKLTEVMLKDIDEVTEGIRKKSCREVCEKDFAYSNQYIDYIDDEMNELEEKYLTD